MAFNFSAQQLANITDGLWIGGVSHATIFNSVVTDSRKYIPNTNAIFFAIVGERFDGHDYCVELAAQGQKVFVLEKEIDLPEDCSQLVVKNTLDALQKIAAAHRLTFKGKVIGITGSNGKTIVKEWLFELLSSKYSTYKSPKSFNSQIGVALSLLNANPNQEFYLIEAGISQKGEMKKLATMIKPDFGIFTHLGQAHSEGFENDEEKFFEKCELFAFAQKTFFHASQIFLENAITQISGEVLLIGKNESADYRTSFDSNSLVVHTVNSTYEVACHFVDTVSRNNLALAVCVALDLGVENEAITKISGRLQNLSMRLELLQGQYNSTIINDTWTNDPDALVHAIDFLTQQRKQKKSCLILSDFPEATDHSFYAKTAELINQKNLETFVGIGPIWKENQDVINTLEKHFFDNVSQFLENVHPKIFAETAILIKGSRRFELDKIANRLQLKTHQTVLEINLDNLAHNYHLLRNRVDSKTKIMAMVKAFAYGSGNYEVAKLLSHHKVDYLAVAYIDEGVELRNAGIKTPILVLNPELNDIEKLADFQLEPAVGSFLQLEFLLNSNKLLKIHLELDTGMHRLGFQSFEKELLVSKLKQSNKVIIQGVFTHLAASDEVSKDNETKRQIADFDVFSRYLINELKINPILHVSNSTGAIRFAEAGGHMVRLGISLYGIDPSNTLQSELKNVFTFKTHITQIKKVSAGQGIGYGFHDATNKNREIAIIAVGYADGFNRHFSQGKQYVLVNNQQAFVVGNVCMDMSMIDVTDLKCNEGDEVILFGEGLPVQQWADNLQTIPYEILTSISQRVRRVFVSEV